MTQKVRKWEIALWLDPTSGQNYSIPVVPSDKAPYCTFLFDSIARVALFTKVNMVIAGISCVASYLEHAPELEIAVSALSSLVADVCKHLC